MKAQPEPIVAGKYFLPNAPLLCLKRIPACPVTSVNSIAPEGRGGVGLAEGEGDAEAATADCCATDCGGACLQDVITTIMAIDKPIEMMRISEIGRAHV